MVEDVTECGGNQRSGEHLLATVGIGSGIYLRLSLWPHQARLASDLLRVTQTLGPLGLSMRGHRGVDARHPATSDENCGSDHYPTSPILEGAVAQNVTTTDPRSSFRS